MAVRNQFEVIIIGGGIAGTSLAYFLCERGLTDVLLLERETQHGYHSTGRSAASLVEFDSNPSVLQLKILGAPFLRNPPPGFCENPLLRRSGIMVLLQSPMPQAMREAISQLAREHVRFEELSAPQAAARVPTLATSAFDGALLLPEDGRIDVHELLSSYIRHARNRGVTVRLGAEVIALRIEGGRCRGVVTNEGEISARMVVDAAGAWAGRVSQLAGVSAVPLEPRRRTIVIMPAPDGIEVGAWPFVISEDHQLYFAPESGGLLLSPMDEDPMDACDPEPDDLVIAQALERLDRLAPRLVPRTLSRKWSGLRTFSPDGVAVVGEDPKLAGFFWLAGQAGYGIETSPAVGKIAADLIARGRTDLFDPAKLSPARFAKA